MTRRLISLAVDFLWHLDVERAGACHEVCQLDALLLSHDSGSHCRCEVIDYDYYIGRVLLQIYLEGAHHLSRDFIEADAVDAEEDIGARYLEVAEEGALEGGVIARTCVNETVTDVVGLVDGADERCHLNEIWPCSSHDTYFFH